MREAVLQRRTLRWVNVARAHEHVAHDLHDRGEPSKLLHEVLEDLKHHCELNFGRSCATA